MLNTVGQRFSASLSRSTRCRILPVAVRGMSLSAMNDTERGRLWPAILSRPQLEYVLLDGGLPRVHDDHRVHGFAPLLVRNPHHRDILDARVAPQTVLDLARVDVLTAADDHVALAVDEVDVAVLVAACHVADTTVAVVADRLPGLDRIVEVAIEGIRRARKELAHLAVGHLLALPVGSSPVPTRSIRGRRSRGD